MDKRMQVISNFFRRMDRIALFGPDGQMLKEQKKEKQEMERVRILEQSLDTCPMCGSTASFKRNLNIENPEGISIQCNKCRLETPEYAGFTNMVNGRSSWSLIKSAQLAAEHWNTRL